MRKIAQIIFAAIAMLLGAFWFLQGVGILNVCPILCFANCACIVGGSLVWGTVGGVVFIIGIIIIFIPPKRN